MSLYIGTRHPYGSHVRRTGHNPPRGISVDLLTLQKKRIARTLSSMNVVKGDERINSIPEMGYDEIGMGKPIPHLPHK
jgi:hypothetical protein